MSVLSVGEQRLRVAGVPQLAWRGGASYLAFQNIPEVVVIAHLNLPRVLDMSVDPECIFLLIFMKL